MDTVIFYNGRKYCAELPEKYMYPVYVRLPNDDVLVQRKRDGAWEATTVWARTLYNAHELQRPPENMRLYVQEKRVEELAGILNTQVVPVPEYATIDQRLAIVEENIALIREKLGLV